MCASFSVSIRFVQSFEIVSDERDEVLPVIRKEDMFYTGKRNKTNGIRPTGT